ncbi:MAG: hypothetical protein INR70_25430 [Parafilimonas terrae]|nr:hypothetical protein [Parafilimonas terrae]
MTSTTKLTFLTGKGRHRAWIARITGRDAQYGLAREFLKGTEFYDNGPQATFDVLLIEGEIYEDWTGDFYVVREGALADVSRHDKAEILALLDARAKAAEQPAADTAEKPVVGPFDARAREAGYVEPALPITPLSVMYAVHGPHGVENLRMGDLDWLRRLLRTCQNPGAFAVLLGYPEDHPKADPDAILQMIQGVEDMYRRLATLTGGNPAIYDSEIRHAAPAEPRLNTEDAIIVALDACRTMEDVNGVLSAAITACHGNRPNFDDEAELGPDSIAVLTDGAVLAWGQCGYHRGHDTRSLVVYETPDKYRTVLSLDQSAEIHDEDDLRHAA